MSLKTVSFERTTPLKLAKPHQKDRVITLDGLRGFLALGVFFHHAAIYQDYLRDGSWYARSSFFAMLGPLGVTLFFMITAYLFYGRLLREEGRPSWTRLYIGRLFRIGPVYLLAVFAMFATVAVASLFELKVPLSQLAGEVLCWLTLGAGPGVDVNGFPDTRHLLAGVTWTLQSEWIFYLSLPLLALATRNVRRGGYAYLVMPAVGLGATLVFLTFLSPSSFPACVGPFFAGMGCAALGHGKTELHLPNWLSSLLVVTALAAVFVLCESPRTPSAIALLGCAFYLIVSGCTVFGLLTCRPALWLGAISYGVYMFHGLVLSRLCAIDAIRNLALQSPAGHLAMALLATISVVALATAAHLLAEQPCIRLGARLAASISRRTGPVRSAAAPHATVGALDDGRPSLPSLP